MKGITGRVLIAMLAMGAAQSLARATDSSQPAPTPTPVLHVTYYFLPG